MCIYLFNIASLKNIPRVSYGPILQCTYYLHSSSNFKGRLLLKNQFQRRILCSKNTRKEGVGELTATLDLLPSNNNIPNGGDYWSSLACGWMSCPCKCVAPMDGNCSVSCVAMVSWSGLFEVI